MRWISAAPYRGLLKRLVRIVKSPSQQVCEGHPGSTKTVVEPDAEVVQGYPCRQQQDKEALRAADGGSYFIYGWALVVEEMFERSLIEDDLILMESEALLVHSRAGS